DNNLTFPGYPATSGNATLVEGGSGSREDANRQFTALNAGSVYAAFLVEPVSATTGDYFLHLGPTDMGTNFRGRVFIRETADPIGGGGTVQFGVSKGSTSDIGWTTDSYATGATYLLVLKYNFLPDATDDTVELFVFEAGDDISVEPGTPDASQTDTTTDPADLGTVALRQGGNAYGVTVDGIRIGRAWDQAVIPVELTAFTATSSGADVRLAWATASETNNAGFEVQMQQNGGWAALAFVEGHGTTTEAQTYGYTVAGLDPGTYTFRLKQVDFDGAFEYSPEVEATVETPGTHLLGDAYPNPFNPRASFSLSVAATQHVEIGLYNTLGQRVATIFEGTLEHGSARTFTIDGAGLPSGTYTYRAVGERFA